MSANSDAIDQALALVTCASAGDVPAARAVLLGLTDEQLRRLALHLAGRGLVMGAAFWRERVEALQAELDRLTR